MIMVNSGLKESSVKETTKDVSSPQLQGTYCLIANWKENREYIALTETEMGHCVGV